MFPIDAVGALVALYIIRVRLVRVGSMQVYLHVNAHPNNERVDSSHSITLLFLSYTHTQLLSYTVQTE